MIIPRVKQYRETEGNISFGEEIRVWFAGETAQRLAFAARELLYPVQITEADSAEGADLILRCGYDSVGTGIRLPDAGAAENSLWMQKGDYRITCKERCVIVTAAEFAGGRNALATLSQLLQVEKGYVTMPKVDIADAPDASFRSFMHDVGRKFIPLEELKMHLLLMAKCKMNVLHFHFTEYVGFAIAFSAFPELKGPACTGGRQYTEAQILELVEYAAALGIEVIPEIDLPGHANAITDAYPALRCQPQDGRASHGWALCVGNEQMYEFLECLIAETVKLFPSPYFHIGTDEITMGDVIRTPRPLADWLDCTVCQAMARKEQLENDTQLFYYFLRRVYAILKKLGKRMIMWNDQIDISVSPDLPRDILIEFWRVAAPTRGPVEGCSMQRFLEEGFSVINANFPDTYIDLYVEYDRLKSWDYRRNPASDAETAGVILGGDVCAWDVFAHFAHTVPVSIACFADRFWNRKPITEEQVFRIGLTELLLGEADFDFFEYTKDVIVLDNENRIFREDIDREALRERLADQPGDNPVEQHMKRVYRQLLSCRITGL